jgi:SAM-dependent methyltransferase
MPRIHPNDKELRLNELQLLVDLHASASRQGPGADAETERAIDLAGIDRRAPLKVADIGCGTGASTLVLARLLNAQITAVDFLPEFVRILEDRAREQGVIGSISTLSRSMDDLPFGDEEYDVIWSEGAVYNIGFRRGVSEWRRYLKAGGVLVVSELTWLTASRPSELTRHWEGEYAEVDVASSKLGILEQSGYSPIGYFVLPEQCWLDNYYRPLKARFEEFLARHENSAAARELVEAEEREIELYQNYKTYYSYGVYIATKLG